MLAEGGEIDRRLAAKQAQHEARFEEIEPLAIAGAKVAQAG